MKKNIYHLTLISFLILFGSCGKDFTETQFFQEDRADEGISSVEQLSSILRGAYVNMRDANYLGCNYRAYAEIRSDEMYYLFKAPSFLIWCHIFIVRIWSHMVIPYIGKFFY